MEFKKIAFTDIDGVLRGKFINVSKLNKKQHIEHCDVIFGWDVADHCYPNDSVTGWGKGFPDGLLTLDSSTKRNIPWEDNVEIVLGDFSEDENLKNVCPRTLLKNILAEYHEFGIYPKVGFEYEWFNFRTDPNQNNPNSETITNGMFGYSLIRLSQNQEFVQQLLKDLPKYNITIDGLHTETGPGVYEAAIKYGEALEAADQAILFKHAVKEIGDKHNIKASFMAKWKANLPGCGGHIHISLEDKEGNSLLNYNRKQEMNDTSTHFLAGILEGTIPLFPMYAPTVNSYKRYISGSWAATALNWGFQNRTTVVRLIEEKVSKCHLEVRAPGADSNPYLALSAALASGLYGIKEKLLLQQTECKGNAYEDLDAIQLPKSLEQGVQIMERSNLGEKILNNRFLNHFIMTRKWEVEQYQKAVTDWEINRYLEII